MPNEKHSTGPSLQDEQILSLGQLATEAFNNQMFQIWYDLMMTRTMQAIDGASPDHSKTVMWEKCKRDVLRQMAADFSGMIKQAETVYARLKEQNDPATKAQQDLDTQGFGLNYDDARSQS